MVSLPQEIINSCCVIFEKAPFSWVVLMLLYSSAVYCDQFVLKQVCSNISLGQEFH